MTDRLLLNFSLTINLRHNQINNKSICQSIFHHASVVNCPNRSAMRAIHIAATRLHLPIAAQLTSRKSFVRAALAAFPSESTK